MAQPPGPGIGAAAGAAPALDSPGAGTYVRAMTDGVLIIDFGSQVTRLIARRIRENGVYCEIAPFDRSEAALRRFAPRGVVLSGGPASVSRAEAPRAPELTFELGVPVLGICYGEQTMVAQLGGEVETAARREFGRASIEVTDGCGLFDGLWAPGDREQVWMSHGDRVVRLPEGFRSVAVSDGTGFAAIADDERRYYGVQFHPEVVHTPRGGALLRNFTHRVAGCAGGWSMAAFRETAVAGIRDRVGGERVVCGLSGGVDSAVAAVLLREAVGDRLTCIFVDTGLLRAGEAAEVERVFRGHFDVPLVVRDAAADFLRALRGVVDPEDKRRIIGAAFVDVFEAEAGRIDGAGFLAQGTLYPDVIESVSPAGGPSATIKSHHNVGGLPERMNLKVVEPLRELFKDEARALGRELGLPESLLGRHPFPGPGLAIRLPGEVTPGKLDVLRRADGIYLEEIRRAGLYDDIWQAFAVLLPVRTVGVMGDERTYEHVCALRAVTSTDGMTADYYPFDTAFIGHVANRIVNEVKGINRVVYDVTSKPPGTIEWE